VKIFITGHRGQLGLALKSALKGHKLFGGDLPDWDMTDPDQVKRAFAESMPDVVVHCAALTDVDYCAQHPDEAVRVNGVGTYNLAVTCREIGASLVAISTNEVFDGKSNRPYQEYDHRSPVNPYGYSKFVAEQVVERYAPHYMIVRTAWLYAPGGVNFIHKILDRARSGQPLKVVTDEVGSPTYAVDLADAVAKLIEVGKPGIYHMVNDGACSRYEFAQEILRQSGIDVGIAPITSDAFDRPSSPPAYAPLQNVFGAALGVSMRPWQDALAAYLADHESE
jgi:dTDP-4-dehydrorhamnose reductase